MSWMGYAAIGVMAASAVLFGVVIIVSYLEGWRWRK